MNTLGYMYSCNKTYEILKDSVAKFYTFKHEVMKIYLMNCFFFFTKSCILREKVCLESMLLFIS